jgi:PPOX class probable F420-dependent enzyme
MTSSRSGRRPGAPDSGGEHPPRLSQAVRRFLEAPRFAVISVLNPDGSPLQAVIWYKLAEDTIVFNSRVGRQWPTNLVRDPRVSLTVADGYQYVELRGEVEADADPGRGQEVIAELAHRYHSDPEEAARAIASFAGQRRITFMLRPSRIFERLSK